MVAEIAARQYIRPGQLRWQVLEPRTLAEIARVLRPGGRIVLAFRTADQPLPSRFDPTVYHVPTTDQATTWLQAAGLTDIHPHQRPDMAPTVTWLAATKPANR